MGKFVERANKERNMSLDGNGEQGRGGTFSSKKVDWTQESGSPRWRRERDRRKQEHKLHQVTRHPGLSVVGVPSPCLPLTHDSDKQQREALSIKAVLCLCPSSLLSQVTIPQQ